jgi:hypothetical protein
VRGDKVIQSEGAVLFVLRKDLSFLKMHIPQSFRTRHPHLVAELTRKRKSRVDGRQEMYQGYSSSFKTGWRATELRHLMKCLKKIDNFSKRYRDSK